MNIFTENKDFYPTPPEVIQKMLYGIDFKYINSILEPSAGTGNLVDALKEKEAEIKKFCGYRDYQMDIDCVESDPNLRSILKGKGYKVVSDDFLTYSTSTWKEYGLILSNPPFSCGAKHLLKMLEMQRKSGGALVCLLNAETIKNAYTFERKDLARKLDEYGANIEFCEAMFEDAERSTNVEIAIIKLQFPAVEKTSFILEDLKKKHFAEATETETHYELADADIYKSIVRQYETEVEAGIRLIKEYNAMRPYILNEFKKDENGEQVNTGCILSLDLSSNHDRYGNKLTVNSFVEEVRGKYWKTLFARPEFMGQLTNKLRCNLQNQIDELKKYDFSLFNIYQLKLDMQKSVVSGVEDTIIEFFDELSYRYHWHDETSANIHYYNGWKTNQSWIINKKCIIPMNAFSSYSGSYDPLRYEITEKIKDMEKCFAFLAGDIVNGEMAFNALKKARDEGITKNIPFKYFSLTFYKKGTMHITFTNEELLKKFNIFGSEHKGWLPPSYGKAAYEELSEEEQKVIDEFEGKDSYNQVMARKEYYLTGGSSSIRQITAKAV